MALVIATAKANVGQLINQYGIGTTLSSDGIRYYARTNTVRHD